MPLSGCSSSSTEVPRQGGGGQYDAQAELCSRLFALGEKATCKEVEQQVRTFAHALCHQPKSVTEVLTSLARRGWDDSLAYVISSLRRSALEVNTYHLSSGIAASARRSLWAVALNKLQEMHSCAIPPNEYSLSSAIVAGQQDGQWRNAVNILSGSRNPGLHRHEILSAGVMRASIATCLAVHLCTSAAWPCVDNFSDKFLYKTLAVEAGCWPVAVEILLHTSVQRLRPTERQDICCEHFVVKLRGHCRKCLWQVFRTFNAALAPSGRDNWAQSAGSMLQSEFPFSRVWHTGMCPCSGAGACSNAEPAPEHEKATCCRYDSPTLESFRWSYPSVTSECPITVRASFA
ncbi:unnamed protein product [Symbiodinium sp. CCMP2456]|nr:unnamed protein product [Symbiodinium sp. CCMP2456]